MTQREMESEIRALRQEVRELRQRTAAVPLRTPRGGGSGGGGIIYLGVVESLPAVNDTGCYVCFWTSIGAGDGDDQFWMNGEGQDKWHRINFMTLLSGTP